MAVDRAGTLILVRHGESTANADGTFTGSRDVDLSARGLEQSRGAAVLMAAEGLVPDVVILSRGCCAPVAPRRSCSPSWG